MSKLSDATTLLKVDIEHEEFHLTMTDGSKWFVGPDDLTAVATWLPTTEVVLEENDNSMFSFDITNTSEGVTIKAMRVA